jgi:hypothetical protein
MTTSTCPVEQTIDAQKRLYRSFRTRLTRRVNKHDWHGVQMLWIEFQEFYSTPERPMPDDWRRWERAAEDARFEEQRRSSGRRVWR